MCNKISNSDFKLCCKGLWRAAFTLVGVGWETMREFAFRAS